MEKNDYLIQVVAKDGFVAEIIQRQATGEDVIKTANLLKDNPKAERVNIRNITRTERRIVCFWTYRLWGLWSGNCHQNGIKSYREECYRSYGYRLSGDICRRIYDITMGGSLDTLTI